MIIRLYLYRYYIIIYISLIIFYSVPLYNIIIDCIPLYSKILDYVALNIYLSFNYSFNKFII